MTHMVSQGYRPVTFLFMMNAMKQCNAELRDMAEAHVFFKIKLRLHDKIATVLWWSNLIAGDVCEKEVANNINSSTI